MRGRRVLGRAAGSLSRGPLAVPDLTSISRGEGKVTMNGPSGRSRSAWPADSAYRRSGWEQAWTIAMDTLARASVAAAAATVRHQLQVTIARALTGAFADWVFADLDGRTLSRAVASRHPDPVLAAALGGLRAGECPLIRSAMRRCTPTVTVAAGDSPVLGTLPGGRPVAAVLGVRSVATAPIVKGGIARGAITIARCAGSPGLGFLELGTLSQIAELTSAAITRLDQASAV
jgi:GAF domain-containing protein